MGISEFIILYLMAGLISGFVVYVLFYLVFQKYVASKTPEERSQVSTLMVMGGFRYDEVPRESITRMVRSIFRRAIGAGGPWWVLQGVSKWYVLALIALIALVFASLLYGW